MLKIYREVQGCTLCAKHLPHEPRPVLQVGSGARVVIIGQAPGRKVHDSGVPWDDASGDRLRQWMGVDDKTFYNKELIALVPMGFCYPGKGRSGDLPPREECAPAWHSKILSKMPRIGLTLLIGQYAQKYYLLEEAKDSLTDTVKAFDSFLPDYFPLPHPSPRNNIWIKKNPWFEKSLLPQLRRRVASILG